uniref:3'-5' exonuclease domain-containing protein n=1 Tax=Panagrolaimus superbus TaxID=310955 RepID=A0A914XZ12_9BILA
MLYDVKTFNNALEWIKNFDFDKLKDCTTKITTAKNVDKCLEWMELVQKTSKELHYFYSNNALHEFSTCISAFYSQCPIKWLRSATMDLICHTEMLLSNIENSDPSLVICQILLGFEAFLKGKSQTISQNVENDLWESDIIFIKRVLRNNIFRIKALKVVIAQRCAIFRKESATLLKNDSLEVLPGLDLLFKVHHPENEARKESILDTIRELLGNEKTVIIGVERVQALKLDLDNLKINTTAVVDVDVDNDNDNQPWLDSAQKMIAEIIRLDYDYVNSCAALDKFFSDPILLNPKRKETLKKSKPDIVTSITPCPLEFLRPATMELLFMVDLTMKTPADLIHYICKKYYSAVFARFKQVNVNVSDELWLIAWEICIENRKLRDLRASSPIESLFRINKPETIDRKDVIYNSIREMLSKNDTFYTAIPWINKFKITELKEEQFGHVDIYECIFQNGRKTYFEKFTAKKDRIQYLKTLDNLLQQIATDTSQIVCKKKEFTVEKLLQEICSLAETLDIVLEEHNLYAFKAKFIQKTKIAFEFLDRLYFELNALEDLSHREYKYKVWFLQSILADKNYAYCWAKYLKILDQDIPKELKSCSILVSEDDLSNFKNEINEKLNLMLKNQNLTIDKDHEEMCKFWGRKSKLFTILTRNGLYKFMDEYFIKSKPKYIGIDIETGKCKDAAVLQIATLEFTCLIDIQELFDKLSENEWKNDVFIPFFDSDILRVGFSFHNDFEYLCNKFPYLQDFFQERKVLCLQKLADYIIKLIDENIIVEYFCTDIKAGSGLAKLTKAVLNLNMDKTLQNSNWIQRPLTHFQKIYAVSDALIVVLLKDEMQTRLER